MTIRPFTILAVLLATLFAVGFVSTFGQSVPPTVTGRVLQIEMNAYIEKFTDEVGITDADLQWAVMVLPVLEMGGPAVTYGWLLPPEDRYVEGGYTIWIAMFTFLEDEMLMMPPRMRRVIAGHEVAHMMPACMKFPVPDLEGVNEWDALILDFNHSVLVESCADMVSAGLTSAYDVLETLLFLQETWADSNPVLAKRIQVMQQQLEWESHNVE